MISRTAEEYKEHIEGTLMYALKRKMETANDWKVLAKFILPAVLADKDVRLREEGETE